MVRTDVDQSGLRYVQYDQQSLQLQLPRPWEQQKRDRSFYQLNPRYGDMTDLTITTPSTFPCPRPILSRTLSGTFLEILFKALVAEWDQMTGASVISLSISFISGRGGGSLQSSQSGFIRNMAQVDEDT
jgi:hypothetical protein